jgi:hypothetical protein
VSITNLFASLEFHRDENALRLIGTFINEFSREKKIDLALQPEETTPKHALACQQLVNF